MFTWNPHNLKGNRENAGMMELNDAVLAASGGAGIGLLIVRWTDQQSAWRDRIVEMGTKNRTNWGFKDPRTLLTCCPSGAYSSADMRFAGTFRHPALVAASLEARNRMAADDALVLWAHYNRRLLDLHENSIPAGVVRCVGRLRYSAALKLISDYPEPRAASATDRRATLPGGTGYATRTRRRSTFQTMLQLYIRLLDAHQGLVTSTRWR